MRCAVAGSLGGGEAPVHHPYPANLTLRVPFQTARTARPRPLQPGNNYFQCRAAPCDPKSCPTRRLNAPVCCNNCARPRPPTSTSPQRDSRPQASVPAVRQAVKVASRHRNTSLSRYSPSQIARTRYDARTTRPTRLHDNTTEVPAARAHDSTGPLYCVACDSGLPGQQAGGCRLLRHGGAGQAHGRPTRRQRRHGGH